MDRDSQAMGRSKYVPLIPDTAAFKKSLAVLPVSTYEPGTIILAAGSATGQLLILKKGVVEVVREGAQIATVSEHGAVFGELAALLDKPHTADVRAIERSELHVANAASLLAGDTAALHHVARIFAHRLDAADAAIVEIKRQLESGKPHGVIAKTIKKLEELLVSQLEAQYRARADTMDPAARL
jgi:CRP-like cAMP-binding protein